MTVDAFTITSAKRSVMCSPFTFQLRLPLLAPFLGIAPTALLLLPLHVVLLEVLIDPTCSIVLERQPAETDIMERRPRDPKETLLTTKLLVKSVLQGLTIFAASFGAYFETLGGNPEKRTCCPCNGSCNYNDLQSFFGSGSTVPTMITPIFLPHA